MPISMTRVNEVDIELGSLQFEHEQQLRTNKYVNQFESEYAIALAHEYNSTRKKKRKTPRDFADYRLNTNSGDQVADLLHEIMELPVLETTPSGKPSTSGDVLKALKNHTSDPDKLEVLDALKASTDIQKIRGTFIKAFREYSILKSDGNWYLHGGFNIGGTVSGRLSSSQPVI
jgi:DNA polymerase-1